MVRSTALPLMAGIFRTFRQKTLHLQIWLLMGFIGIARVLKDIITDLVSNFGSNNFIVDIPILGILSTVFFLIWNNRITKIPIYVPLLIIALAILSYYKLGGIRGNSEYNQMAVAFLITLGYEKRNFNLLLYIFVIVTICTEIILNREFPIRAFTTTNFDSYLTTALTLTSTAIWLKYLLTKETEKLLELRNTLVLSNKKLRGQHRELEKQNELLEISTKQLAKDERSNTTRIEQQRKAIDDFVILSTTAIRIPLEKMLSARVAFDINMELEKKLEDQILELEEVIRELEKDLENREKSNLS